MAGPPAGRGVRGDLHRRDRGQGPRRQVANRPIYAAIGVTLDGEKDILGLWAGTGGEGAKFWMACSPTCATAACRTCSSWSATG